MSQPSSAHSETVTVIGPPATPGTREPRNAVAPRIVPPDLETDATASFRSILVMFEPLRGAAPEAQGTASAAKIPSAPKLPANLKIERFMERSPVARISAGHRVSTANCSRPPGTRPRMWGMVFRELLDSPTRAPKASKYRGNLADIWVSSLDGWVAHHRFAERYWGIDERRCPTPPHIFCGGAILCARETTAAP